MTAADRTAAERYLGLVKKSLLNEFYLDLEAILHYILLCERAGERPNPEIVRNITDGRPDIVAHLAAQRAEGQMVYWQLATGELFDPRNLAEHSHTMIGRRRLDHLHRCLDIIHDEGLPGDFIETGVWRGGATIFMRAHLAAHAVTHRRVWVADSFQGLPEPSARQDIAYDLSARYQPILAVRLERVQDLFDRYDLLDDQVCFLAGWFRDTLPTAPITQLALLRLDGDLYESTMDALVALYEKVVPGGFIIVDDYGALPPCREAVDTFRSRHGITAPLDQVDWTGVAWRKGDPSGRAVRPGGRGSFRRIHKPAPLREECRFYHRVDLPDGPTEGQWDLRPNVAAYLGGISLDGCSVLEVGPASGYLSFHMERAGATVTAIEPSMERLWDSVPLSGQDRERWRQTHEQHIIAVRNSFWYLHHLYESKVSLIEADPETLPATLGDFDVGLFAAVLLHTRSPFSVLEGVAARVRNTIIVTELFDVTLGSLPVIRLLPGLEAPAFDTWWSFSPAFLVRALECLGFPHAEVSYHSQLRVEDGMAVPMCTVVAHRTPPAEGFTQHRPPSNQPPAPISAEQAEMQLAVVRDLRWLPHTLSLSDAGLTVSGWLLTVWEDPATVTFVVNDAPATHVEWPLPSPDLTTFFGLLPQAGSARFQIHHACPPDGSLFPNGVATLDVRFAGPHSQPSYRTAWYLLDPALEAPLPPIDLLTRSIGSPDAVAFRLGGATNAHRIDGCLRALVGRGLSDFRRVLEWGCRAGQLTRYLIRFVSDLVCAESDDDFVTYCRTSFTQSPTPGVEVLQLAGPASLDYPDQQVDLIIALSAVTNLDHAAEQAWLREMERLLEPDGLLLLSVQGFAQSCLYQTSEADLRSAQQTGLHNASGRILRSTDYIRTQLTTNFAVLDILPGLACGQDLVILRKKTIPS